MHRLTLTPSASRGNVTRTIMHRLTLTPSAGRGNVTRTIMHRLTLTPSAGRDNVTRTIIRSIDSYSQRWLQQCFLFLFLCSFLNSCGCSTAPQLWHRRRLFFYPLNGSERGSHPSLTTRDRIIRSIDSHSQRWPQQCYTTITHRIDSHSQRWP